MTMITKNRSLARMAAGIALLWSASAPAGLVLSQAVVDITPDRPVAQDIELWNDGADTSYVVAEPHEILNAGLPGEQRRRIVDPGEGGLLVSPQRLILQPHERKLVRIAAITARPDSDRVYRVTIKPVAGPAQAEQTALKLLVGYDVLVLYRPQAPTIKVIGQRIGMQVAIRNEGNTSVEMYDGKQCVADRNSCVSLRSIRLYPGQDFTQKLMGSQPVEYHVAAGLQSSIQKF